MLMRRRKVLAAGATLAAGSALSRSACAADSIKLGFTTALTGPFNEFGEGYKRGIEIALEIINKAGGVMGRPMEIGVMLDDQLVPDRAVQNMRRILDNKDIAALFCPSGSGPTLAIADMATADGRPFINPQAQTPTIIYPDGYGKKPRPNMFSMSIQNDIEAGFMADIVARKATRIGLLNESTGYGKTFAELIKSGIMARNKDAVITHESYNQKDQDMTAQLVRVQRARSETLMFVGLGADLAVIRKNMVRMNMTIPLLTSAGGLSPPYLEGAGELVLGTKGSLFAKITREPRPPETAAFLDAYKAKHGNDRLWGADPDRPYPSLAGTVACGYDGTMLLAEAFKRAGSTEPGAVIKAMESIKGFLGCNGTYDFSDMKHHAIEAKDLATYEYVKRDGKIVLVQTVL